MRTLTLFLACYLLFSYSTASAQQKLTKKTLDTTAEQVPVPPLLFAPKVGAIPAPKLYEEQRNLLYKEDENKLICYVFSEASPDKKEWNRHLQKQLRLCLDSPAKRGKSPGNLSVRIQLHIEKDGKIGKVDVIDSIDFDLRLCIITAVHMGPKWFPKYDCGRAVASVQVLKVTFVIPNETEPF